MKNSPLPAPPWWGLSVPRLVAVVLVTLLLWLALLAGLAARHGATPPASLSAETQPLTGWQLVQGVSAQKIATAENQNGPNSALLSIAELGGGGEFFAVTPVSFDAGQWPVLSLNLENYPLNYVLMLAWKRAGQDEVDFTRLQVPRGGSQSYLMSRREGWSGSVVELGLYGYPQPQTSPAIALDQPITLSDATRGQDSWLARIQSLWTGWVAMDPWAMLSVSSLGRYRDLEEGRGLTPVVGAAAALLLLVLVLVGGLRDQRLASAGLAVLLAATALLQWQSTRSLLAQAGETRRYLGNLDATQRNRFQFDQELIDLVAQVRPALKPGDRIHAVTDDRFFNLRAAWHLRPANVSTFYMPEKTSADAVKAGDLLFFYRRPGLQQAASTGRMALGGKRWWTQPLINHPSGSLVRLLRPAL